MPSPDTEAWPACARSTVPQRLYYAHPSKGSGFGIWRETSAHPKLSACAQFVKVKDLVDKFANESADVVGVVDKVEPAGTITTRDGREVGKL